MQTYLGRLVTNIWHATIWQPTSVLSPSAPKLLFSIAFCFRGLRLSNLHLHWGAVPVPMLQLFFAILAARCSGDDSKFSCPFPILSSSVAGFRAGLGFGVAAVAVVAVGGRKRSFALDAAQHDQVDEAAIPALLGQVTARRGMRRDYQLLAPWCPHPAPAPQDAAPHDVHAPSQTADDPVCGYTGTPQGITKCSLPSVAEGNNTIYNVKNNIRNSNSHTSYPG